MLSGLYLVCIKTIQVFSASSGGLIRLLGLNKVRVKTLADQSLGCLFTGVRLSQTSI